MNNIVRIKIKDLRIGNNMNFVVKRHFIAIVVSLLGLLCAPEAYAMQKAARDFARTINQLKAPAKIAELQSYIAAQKRSEAANKLIIEQKLSELPSDEVLICQQGTAHCIPVKYNIFPVIAEMFKDLGYQEKQIIEFDFPIKDIHNAASLATTYSLHKDLQIQVSEIEKSIQSYSLNELIGTVNVLDVTDCSFELQNICLNQIKSLIGIENLAINEMIQKLRPGLQISLLVAPTISKLKKIVIEKHSQDRTITSVDQQNDHLIFHPSVKTAWSPNESNVILKVGLSKIYLYNTSNPRKMTLQDKFEFSSFSLPVFSPDSKKIAYPQVDFSICVYDINKKEKMIINTARFGSNNIAFTSDSNHLFALSQDDGSSLFLLSLNDKDKAPQKITHDFSEILTLATNKNGTILAVKGFKNGVHLVLYNIKDLENISVLSSTDQVEPSSSPMKFSSNGKMILCCNNLYPWAFYHISDDAQKITTQTITRADVQLQNIDLSMLTPDNKNMIASGSFSGNDIFFWDMSDFSDISHFSLGKGYGASVAPSFTEGCRIAFVNNEIQPSGEYRIKRWLRTLWTRQEQKAFETLQTCDADKLRFVYGWCLKLEKNSPTPLKQGTIEWDTFESLPIEVQNILNDLLRAPRKG